MKVSFPGFPNFPTYPIGSRDENGEENQTIKINVINRSAEEMLEQQRKYDEEFGYTKKKEEKPKIDFNQMVEEIKKIVKGQDNQIEKLCATIIRNSMMSNSKRKNHIIIVGDSGTGKTLMLDQLEKVTNKVCSYEAATSYTEEGYVGDSVNDMLLNLLNRANGNLDIAQEGIIVIDEGDKKAGSKDDKRDVSGAQVLLSMLKMLDGSSITINRKDRNIQFDTSKVTFIFMGVFDGMEEVIKNRTSAKKTMGFSDKVYEDEFKTTRIIPNDFIQLGFPKEFIARFPVIIKMNPMNVEVIKTILDSENGYFKQELERIEDAGAKVEYSQDVIDEIAEFVINQQIGARGIERTVNYIFEQIWYDILRGNESKNIRLLKGIVYDNTKYVNM